MDVHFRMAFFCHPDPRRHTANLIHCSPFIGASIRGSAINFQEIRYERFQTRVPCDRFFGGRCAGPSWRDEGKEILRGFGRDRLVGDEYPPHGGRVGIGQRHRHVRRRLSTARASRLGNRDDDRREAEDLHRLPGADRAKKPEIVIVATPDHWHPLIMIAAVETGAHVYVEKPISHTVLEGVAMVKAARAKRRVGWRESTHSRRYGSQRDVASRVSRRMGVSRDLIPKKN